MKRIVESFLNKLLLDPESGDNYIIYKNGEDLEALRIVIEDNSDGIKVEVYDIDDIDILYLVEDNSDSLDTIISTLDFYRTQIISNVSNI